MNSERTANAVDTALTGVSRLCWLLAWTWLVMAHALLLLLWLLLAWAFQVRPPSGQEIAAYLQSPALGALLTASGVSLYGLFLFYRRLVPAAARAIEIRIRKYWVSGL
jgi:hypothetical protein